MKKKYKAAAVSPANIAFIKYWGKKDPKINLPFNNSISMNLSGCHTTTEVEFDPRFNKDRIFIDSKEVEGEKKTRVVKILDLIRKKAKKRLFAKVVSKNNFPSDAGIASSASAFSALALAGSKAIGLKLSQRELSTLARLGSGSACRSVVDGFAEWKKGKDNKTSYAVQLAKPDYWNLVDIVAVVDKGKKKASSTEGHQAAVTSPYFKTRLLELKERISRLRRTLLERQFKEFGRLLEEEAISLHVTAMTSKPPIFYWNKGTLEVMEAVFKMREKGIRAYFTMDAGSNVHVICLEEDGPRVRRNLGFLSEVLFTIFNRPSNGARII
ncbi:MAG: Diphosphomevalonate decarboxylase [Candidatus Woesebacteria bacterium GW2011_GWA1_40_43]|uniref:diphosphomevalonate decarboxylase n=5 Tax=Microgenomates group TaxID=1794810 RepID=A0A0G1N6L4_9BACT|nr:MAG: Diphosphomevalonate decarboxylase [Candidatus Woesebacteria bacterium GW2011_GWA1_40_43]KKT66061.1 MAG: Diphosphomevalonate decarboxylase [Candidatus Woesebacteria bacterium GW2011_GWA2_44_33]KKT67061.1 MAG: diphosphomevalonate decarboxylase, diphosphomevalonate decarboxylase [Candidatus Curtissbacteria bacterium GW2011_GWC1_44_33]KKU16179.1 MAG: Diphosphomevalonate decarboxylase [Candidatus Woesebacteria bacterium GW2011_GWC2_45_9]OGM84187.1 MAG: diphosphomevalonate decarboxylase [Cand